MAAAAAAAVDGESKGEDVAKQLRSQFQFYFSESNIPFDDYLSKRIADGGDEGWVPFDDFLKFNRVKALTTDKAVLAAAVREDDSGLLAVSDDGLKVRRVTPLPADAKAQVINRSVSASGVPARTPLDDVKAFFEEHAPVQSVRWNHTRRKYHIEFADEDTAVKVAALELKWANGETLKLKKRTYVPAKHDTFNSKHKGKGKGNKSPDKKKKKRKSAGGDEDKADDGDEHKERPSKKAKMTSSFAPGTVARVKGLGNMNGKAVKDAFGDHGFPVDFATNADDQGVSIVRFFSDAKAADIAAAFKEQDLKLKGDLSVEFELLARRGCASQTRGAGRRAVRPRGARRPWRASRP